MIYFTIRVELINIQQLQARNRKYLMVGLLLDVTQIPANVLA
jgi:hypothetical protein